MNLEKIYWEEDVFPREFAAYEERDYGILFYNERNKFSNDSNHAVIFKDRISDIPKVMEDITGFYLGKGIKPVIYQSISDDGYFESIREELAAHGYDVYGKQMLDSAEV